MGKSQKTTSATRKMKPKKSAAKDNSRPTRLGFLAGQILVPKDFDQMFSEEIERLFTGEPSDSADEV
jgi:hypothetical protein